MQRVAMESGRNRVCNILRGYVSMVLVRRIDMSKPKCVFSGKVMRGRAYVSEGSRNTVTDFIKMERRGAGYGYTAWRGEV